MAKDLRSFLAQIKDRILHIQKPADPLTEMGGICQLVEQPVLFENVKGYAGWKVVDRLFASRELVALAAGVPADGMLEHLRDKWLRSPAHEAVTVDHAPVKEKVVKGKEVNLEALPVVVSSPKDSGRFLSAAHLVSANPEGRPQRRLLPDRAERQEPHLVRPLPARHAMKRRPVQRKGPEDYAHRPLHRPPPGFRPLGFGQLQSPGLLRA